MLHEWPSDAATGKRSTPRPAHGPARLSRDQKLDLARIVAAGVLTMAALAGAVWFAACQGGRQQEGRADVGLAAPAVTVQTTEVVAVMTTPDLGGLPGTAVPSARAASSGPARAVARRPAPPAARADASGSLPRRVARFLTGDGTHKVRPFPTVPER